MARQRRVSEKPAVYRRARAVGRLELSRSTAQAISGRSVEKGDPIAVAEIAGLQAMKRTSELIPHCHAVALTGSRVELSVDGDGLAAEAESEAVGPTGVEMEALVGVTVALLTAWDMVKYLEKDAHGVYPNVRLGPVTLAEKEKHEVARP